MTIELPLPPTTNNLFASVGRRRVPSAKYVAWRKLVAPLLATVPPVTTFPVALSLTIIGGKGWRVNSDLDNRVKAVADAIVTAGILPDDSCQYVRRVTVEYCDPTDRHQPATVRVSISHWTEG